jgi:NADH-quinone oxidoreductase subunit C
MALENSFVEERVRSRFGATVLDSTEFRGDLAIRIRPEALPDVALFLHTDPELEYALLSSVNSKKKSPSRPWVSMPFELVLS